MTQRPRGSGRFWRRPTGGWAIEYHGRRESVAKALGKPPSTVTERDAFRLLQRRLQETATGELLAPEHTRLTVRELVTRYLSNLELRKGPRAVARWRSAVTLTRPLHHHRAAALTGPLVDDWMADTRTDGYKPKTVNDGIALLSAAFRYGLRARLVKRAPLFTRFVVSNVRRGFFERDEVAAILPHLAEPYADAVRCAYLTGWRREEVVRLQWAWVDRAAGVLTLPDSKNGEGRTIPLRDEAGALNDLGALLETRWKARRLGIPHVFHRRGRAVSGFALWWAWRTACQAAGFWIVSKEHPQGRPSKLLHDFRRTAARDMVRAGVPETVAMTITGHRTRSMFDRYDISDERDRSRALAALAVYRAMGGEHA